MLPDVTARLPRRLNKSLASSSIVPQNYWETDVQNYWETEAANGVQVRDN
jgi:hypothetical protein